MLLQMKSGCKFIPFLDKKLCMFIVFSVTLVMVKEITERTESTENLQ